MMVPPGVLERVPERVLLGGEVLRLGLLASGHDDDADGADADADADDAYDAAAAAAEEGRRRRRRTRSGDTSAAGRMDKVLCVMVGNQPVVVVRRRIAHVGVYIIMIVNNASL